MIVVFLYLSLIIIMCTDELSKQKVAIKILGKCFAVQAGKDYLAFLYQEYDVSFNLYIVYYYALTASIYMTMYFLS